MTVDELNDISDAIYAKIDECLAGRELDPGLRSGIFLAACARARDGLQPWIPEYEEIIAEFAER